MHYQIEIHGTDGQAHRVDIQSQAPGIGEALGMAVKAMALCLESQGIDLIQALKVEHVTIAI